MSGNDQDKDPSELADELGQLMQELAGDHPGAEPITAQSNPADHETELARLQATIAALSAELRQADARLAQLLQAGQVEIMELLVHSEKSMRRDLLLVEERIRADLAKLQRQIQTHEVDQPETDPSHDSRATNSSL